LSWKSARLLVAAISISACAGPAKAPRTEPGRCVAHARLTSERPAILDVELSCSGREVAAFVASEAESVAHVKGAADAAGNALARRADRFVLPRPTSTPRIRYRVDLDAVARDADSFDVAQRIGRTLIAPVSTWLLHPDPLRTDVEVTLDVETPGGVSFTTGLERSGHGYRIAAHEIPVGTYALFGRFASTTAVLPARRERAGDAELEVAIADGALDESAETMTAWVRESAAAVGHFWRGFPVPRVLVTLIPVPGRHRILFGKVLPESAPGVVILVGQHVRREQLREDWILVHELFHLGVPSFSGEGKWFDEGLATYFEPIIRARAGWRSEESVWSEFVRAMPLGLRAIDETGLENAERYGEIYWGGAIVALLADVEIRRKTAGARGLEDGLRAVLAAGGDASEVWPLDRTLEVSDRGCGVDALIPLARAHARGARHVDLEAVWRSLGIVTHDGSVSLRSDAPLASVRERIVFGDGITPSSPALARTR
jgi:hypothetical protein